MVMTEPIILRRGLWFILILQSSTFGR